MITVKTVSHRASQMAKAMLMYMCVCICVLYTLSIENRHAPYGRKVIKKKKNSMTEKPNLKNCHEIHAAAVETYLLVAFCSLPHGGISKAGDRKSRPL